MSNPALDLVIDESLPPWHPDKFKYVSKKGVDRRKAASRKWNGRRQGDPQLPFTLEWHIRPAVLFVSTAVVFLVGVLSVFMH